MAEEPQSTAPRDVRASSRRVVLVAVLVGSVLYVAAASSPLTGLWTRKYEGDADLYKFYADQIHSGQVPYRDFLIEYPPGSLAVFVPPDYALDAYRGVTGNDARYEGFFKAEMLLCGLGIIYLVASTTEFLWRNPRRTIAAAIVFGVSPLVLGPVALSWYDMWPTLLTIGTVALFVRRRFTAALTLLGVAIAAKLFALVLLPLLLPQVVRRVGWRGALRSVIGCAAVLTLSFGTAAVFSLHGAWYPFSYLLSRPVEIESTAGSIAGILRLAGWWHMDTEVSYGSVNFLGRNTAAIGLALSGAGVLFLVLLWWRAALRTLSADMLVIAASAAIATTMAASKVFSPQYMVWLVPFVALAGRRLPLLLTIAAGVLTRIWFPERWGRFNDIPPLFTLAFARDAAICAVAVLLLCAVLARDRSPAPASDHAWLAAEAQ